MKNPVSFLLTIVLCVASVTAIAQTIENTQSLELRAGKTLSIGDYASLRYGRTTSTSLNVCFGAFINGLQKNGLHYYNYGADLMGEYYTPVGENTDHLFELKIGAGLTGCIDDEPWVYKGLPFAKRLNYGLSGELSAEWRMSENVGLISFIQQKYLFHKPLGNYACTLGLGVKLILD